MEMWTPSRSADASGSCAPTRGMTLEELAAAVDRAPSQLSMIENGRREPKLTLLQAIARALGSIAGRAAGVRAARRAVHARDRARAGDAGADVPGPRHRAVPHRQDRAERGAEGDARAAGRDRAPARRAGGDPRRGPPGQRGAAAAHAHAEQPLPRARGSGATAARRGRPPRRPAHAADGIRHRRPPRVHPALRARPAADHPQRRRHQERPALPLEQARREGRPAHRGAAGALEPDPRAHRAHELRGVPASARRDELPHRARC